MSRYNTTTPLEAHVLAEKLEKERRTLALVRNRIERLARQSMPPIVQEVVLAQREAENARMRLGVALALVNGVDPWTSEVNTGDRTNGELNS